MRVLCYPFQDKSMNEKPELSDGHTKIANEILDTLAKTYLSSYESQFLWFLFRKTYGWNQKNDRISVSQIVKGTGIRQSHVSRTKKKLIERKIVTQTGNKIGFNKYWSQWMDIPKQVYTQTGIKDIPKQVLPPPHSGIKNIPKQGNTNINSKDTITKDSSLKKEKYTDDDVLQWEQSFVTLAKSEGWDSSGDYAEKIWRQHKELRPANREEFYRKIRVLLNSSKHEKTIRLSRKIYFELAGFVNDKGEMEKMIDDKEVKRRQEFAEEESGKNYVEQEL